MGATLKDIYDEFKLYVAGLPHLLAAYSIVEVQPTKVRIWTLLDARDETTENAIARAELKLTQSFREISFDFNTIHLRGRDPVQFVPDGAVPITARDERILRHFQQSITAA